MSSRDEVEVSGDEVFDLLGLPLELKRRVANCLGTRDAVNLAQTCRTLFANLALTHLKPVRPVFTTFERMGDVTTGDRWYRAFRLPVLNRRVHSMRLECRWRDQGWGNRKGECCIVGYPSPSLQENSNNNSNSNSNSNTNDRVSDIPTFFEPTTAAAAAAATGASKPFQGGRVVATSQGTAQHHEERLKMTFSPLENEIYHLWYKVGGGGGHVLYLRTGELHTVIFDDEYRNFSNNYRILFEEGVLCREVVDEYPSHQQRLQQQQQAQAPHLQGLFFPRMLISVSRALRWELQEGMDRNVVLRQRTSSEDELEAFLAEYNIPLNLGSLVALEEIVQADIEERLIRRSEWILQQRLREQEEEHQHRPGVFHIPLGLMPRVVQMAGPGIIRREDEEEDQELDPQDEEEEEAGAEQEREEVQGDDNDNDGALALMDAENEM